MSLTKMIPQQAVIEVLLQDTGASNGDLSVLRVFPKLQTLNLENCPMIGDPGLGWLGDFKQLRVLRLNSCSHITDGGMKYIGKITSLEELYLDQTNVTDNGLKELKGLKNLKKLSLTGTAADGRDLQASIPGLEIVKN